MGSEIQTAIRFPDGVAGADGRAAFIIARGGGVEAVELASGRTRWRSGEATRPLLAAGDTLFASSATGRRVRVLALDGESGRKRLVSHAIELPLEHGDILEARIVGGELQVAWESHRAPTGGMPRPEDLVNAGGTATIDLATGVVVVTPGPGFGPLPPAPLPPALAAAITATAPFAVDGRRAVVLCDGERLVIQRWDPSGGALDPSIELWAPLPRLTAWQVTVSPDGGTAALEHCNDAPEAGRPIGAVCRWELFSTREGRHLGTVPVPEGVDSGLAVGGGRAFFTLTLPRRGDEQPRLLRAVDARSGATLWEHPVAPQHMTPPPQ